MVLMLGDDLKNFTRLGNWIIQESGLTPEQFLLLDELYEQRLGGKRNRFRRISRYTNLKIKRLLNGTDKWTIGEIQLLAELADLEAIELIHEFREFIYEEDVVMVPEKA